MTGPRYSWLLLAAFAFLGLGITPIAANELSPDDQVFAPAILTAEQMPRLHSLLISHRGELVVEKYFNGNEAGQAANVKSVSKSVVSALVGIAIDRGYVTGIDQPIADFYGDVFGDESAPQKREITIGNLLSMQAGLETTSFYNYGAWVQSDDWVGFALKQPLLARPGSRMLYSTGNTHILSAILTETSGKSTLEFAREALGRPLGIHIADWPRDPNGIYFGGNNMEFTPRQMLAFGKLYLNKGRANGRQIVPQKWVETSLEPRVRSRRNRERQYGYGWWVREMAGLNAAYAWGYGGQFIVLVPDLEMVVVTTSSSQPGDTRRRHTRALYGLLEDRIVQPVLRLEKSAAVASP